MAHYLQELGLVDEGDYSITFNGGLVQKMILVKSWKRK
jgi:hypothetical protein